MTDKIKLEADGASLERELKRASQAFKTYHGNIAKVDDVAIKYNRTMTGFVGKVSGVTDANERITKSFTKLNGQYQILSSSVQSLAPTHKELLRIQEAEARQANNLAIAKTKEAAARGKNKAAIEAEQQATAREVERTKQISARGRLATTEGKAKQGVIVVSNEQKRQTQRENAELQRQNTLYAHNLALQRQARRMIDQKVLINIREQNRALREQKQTLGSVLLSWQSIMRLMAVRIGYTAFYTVIDGFKQGVSQAKEFQRAIAGVRTISQQSNLSFSQWADGLQRVSDGWRLDILEQTEAAYQAITNQVVNGTEAFNFLEASNRFATAAFVETNEAVRLVTAAINAFGYTASDAERLYGSFFKTIELGRIRGSEMTEMGRLFLPARTLGIEIDEINAAMATLTRQGVKANEAMTFLRNMMNSLIKPTEAMKEYYAELGVETGQAAISTFGWVGLLQQLEDRFKGSSEELGELFSRIRAMAGVFGQQGRALEMLEDNYNKITTASEFYSNAVDLVQSTSGEKLEIALSRIRNLFIRLGSDVLDSAANLTDGFNDIYKAGRALVGFLRAAFYPAILGAAVAISKLSVALLATPWGAAIAGVTALTSAIAWYATIEERAAAAAREAGLVRERAVMEADRVAKAARDAREEADARAWTRELRGLQAMLAKRVSAVTTTLLTEQELYTKTNRRIVKLAESASKLISDQMTELERDISKTSDNILDLLESARDYNPATDSILFDLELEKRSGQEYLDFIRKRFDETMERAKAAASGGDLDLFKTLIAQVSDLEQRYANAYKSITEANRKSHEERAKLQVQENKTIQEYAEARLAAERRLTEATNDRDRAQIQDELARLRGDFVTKIGEIRDATGQIAIHEVQSYDAIKARFDLVTQLRDLQLEMAKSETARLVALKTEETRLAAVKAQVDDLATGLRDFKIKDVLSGNYSDTDLRTLLDDQVDRLRLLEQINKRENLGLDLRSQQTALAQLQVITETKIAQIREKDRQQQLEAMKTELAELDRLAQAERDRIDNLVSSATKAAARLAEPILDLRGRGLGISRKRYTELGEAFQAPGLSGVGDRGWEDMNATIIARGYAIDGLADSVGNYIDSWASANTLAEQRALFEQFPAMLPALTQMANILKATGQTEQFDNLNEFVRSLTAGPGRVALGVELTRLAELDEMVNGLAKSRLTMQQATSAALEKETLSLERIVTLHQRIAELRNTTPASYAGPDKTRTPIQSGDRVSNTINVNVSGSNSPQVTAQEIGKELKRMINRGTLVLN